uniref:TLC domain-containing protein 2-like n=1 Tax=Ciona intestinalis TaxID=7719 RepID=UPI00052187A5|nr:TLC domain-containing protein 2-like [Ciona intestinalis]|eukprot:XP_026691796.1 TLC domain-containing protein 2-like [Ciona intestinalis]
MLSNDVYSVTLDATKVIAFAVLFKVFSILLVAYGPVPSNTIAIGKQFRWYNITVSLLHSTITSLGALYCFYLDPDLTSDISRRFTPAAHLISCLSTGYFVYDFTEAIKRKKISSTWEIIIHHTVVIICFGIAVFSHQYVSYVIVALLCEINSVFLHARQLLNLSGVSPCSGVYRFNGILNISTYVLFRICTLAWMTRWIVLHRSSIPQPFQTAGILGMMVMTVINVILFARLLFKDYVSSGVTSKPQHSLNNNVVKGKNT